MTKSYRTKSYSVTATLQGDLWMGGSAYKDIDFSTATRQAVKDRLAKLLNDGDFQSGTQKFIYLSIVINKTFTDPRVPFPMLHSRELLINGEV